MNIVFITEIELIIWSDMAKLSCSAPLMCIDEKHVSLRLASNFQNAAVFPEFLLFLPRKGSILLLTFYPQEPSKVSKRLAFGQGISLGHFKVTP